MSEKAPRTNSRLENFDANKAKREQSQFESSLYGDAGVEDFSDDARKRLGEGDAYERHLEKLAYRSDNYFPGDSDHRDAYYEGLHSEALEMDQEYDAETDEIMQSTPAIRRMVLMSERIAELREIAEILKIRIAPENPDSLADPKFLSVKEDKLQELMIDFDEKSELSNSRKQKIFNFIIKTTVQAESAGSHSEADSSDDGSTDETAPAAAGEKKDFSVDGTDVKSPSGNEGTNSANNSYEALKSILDKDADDFRLSKPEKKEDFSVANDVEPPKAENKADFSVDNDVEPPKVADRVDYSVVNDMTPPETDKKADFSVDNDIEPPKKGSWFSRMRAARRRRKQASKEAKTNR